MHEMNAILDRAAVPEIYVDADACPVKEEVYVVARRYGLPYRGSGSLTTAKVPDGQAAYETQWTLWPAVLAHTNLVMHAAGWLEGGLTASFEKFIIDAEAQAII